MGTFNYDDFERIMKADENEMFSSLVKSNPEIIEKVQEAQAELGEKLTAHLASMSNVQILSGAISLMDKPEFALGVLMGHDLKSVAAYVGSYYWQEIFRRILANKDAIPVCNFPRTLGEEIKAVLAEREMEIKAENYEQAQRLTIRANQWLELARSKKG